MKKRILIGILLCYSLTLTQCAINKNSVVTMNFNVVEPSVALLEQEGEEGENEEGNKEDKPNNEITDNRVVEGLGEHQFGFNLDSVVFLGDSRLQGLSSYGYVKNENLVISNEADCSWALNQIETIKAKNPKMIFVGVGLVDVLNSKKSKFKSDYKKLLKELNKAFPDITIGAMTIPMVGDNALEENKKYKEIDEFNKVIRDVSKGKPLLRLDLVIDKDKLSADGVSFHSKGYAVMIDTIKDIIK
ncbi:hypothetical protein [uncultured Clostridium sp.]|uniref:hypothetical protein n=1 Tax=uncultured Clostridium sp. TaxID=59620 RepID=UPI0026F38336|nr:hypothetical protein [uncultured Clostridium sp.]